MSIVHLTTHLNKALFTCLAHSLYSPLIATVTHSSQDISNHNNTVSLYSDFNFKHRIVKIVKVNEIFYLFQNLYVLIELITGIFQSTTFSDYWSEVMMLMSLRLIKPAPLPLHFFSFKCMEITTYRFVHKRFSHRDKTIINISVKYLIW